MDGLTVDRLGRFVVYVDVARALLEQLPPSPTRWKEAVANLVHETPARRRLGISCVLLELAHSVDPEAGSNLWSVYSQVLSDRPIPAKLIDPLCRPGGCYEPVAS